MLAAALLLLCVLASSCRRDTVDPSLRGIYHWKTTYNPTSWELRWMQKHHVGRLYVKFFEVVPNTYADFDLVLMPQATTRFLQPLPAGVDVVPVVYITADGIKALSSALYADTAACRRYAELIINRIEAMAADNGGTGPASGLSQPLTLREVQLDCDWTARTRQAYFLLAAEVRRLLHANGTALSGTLRLHQLAEQHEAPFDRCLLMCYNTGRLQDPSTHNSILSYSDVEPYLRQYGADSLRGADVAFPVYGWGVEFNDEGGFVRLVNSADLPRHGAPGLREEWGTRREIMLTKRALPHLDSLHAVVLYHLDSLNLSKYSNREIEEFYSR